MSGLNLYTKKVEIQPLRHSFLVTFEPQRKTVSILPGKMLDESDGLPCSLLQLELKNNIDLDHSCGGVCACSTCHVIVLSEFESCNVETKNKEDMLNLALARQSPIQAGLPVRSRRY